MIIYFLPLVGSSFLQLYFLQKTKSKNTYVKIAKTEMPPKQKKVFIVNVNMHCLIEKK
jgi:hypothetical protein